MHRLFRELHTLADRVERLGLSPGATPETTAIDRQDIARGVRAAARQILAPDHARVTGPRRQPVDRRATA